MGYFSLNFILFILILFLIYYLCSKKYRWIILLIGSIIFYCLFSGTYIIFIFFSSLVTFVFGFLIDRYKKNKFLLIIPILINLFLLFLLKYQFIDTKYYHYQFIKNIIPIGISYYTLEMIGYIIDIYMEKYKFENNFFKLLLYFMYFPKILMGPFCRYNKTGEKIFNQDNINFEKIYNSILLICYGVVKKLVIADNLKIIVNAVFQNNYGGFVLIISIVFFTIQLYTDFSGYMDIIRGISALFGIELPKNFDCPFFSVTIQEFWRRWHITLGDWLKEYVFFPISLSKFVMLSNQKLQKLNKKFLSKILMFAVPSFFVWIFMGLWHEISIKYIVYGLYYYSIILIGVILKPTLIKFNNFFNINSKSKKYIFLQILKTNFFVFLGMFIFRCKSLSQLKLLLFKLFDKENFDVFLFSINKYKLIITIILFVLILFFEYLSKMKKIDIIQKINKQKNVIKINLLFLLILIIICFSNYEVNTKFLYELF